MNKQQARRVLHGYAVYCRDSYELSQEEWESFLDLPVNIPAEVVKARELVPEAWEHVGWLVWRPTIVWKSKPTAGDGTPLERVRGVKALAGSIPVSSATEGDNDGKQVK